MDTRRFALFTLLTISLLACGDAIEDDDLDETEDTSAAVTSTPVPGAPPVYEQRDYIAEQAAIDSADKRDFERRRASMQSYKSCLVQIQDADADVRKQLARACDNLPDSPKNNRRR